MRSGASRGPKHDCGGAHGGSRSVQPPSSPTPSTAARTDARSAADRTAGVVLAVWNDVDQCELERPVMGASSNEHRFHTGCADVPPARFEGPLHVVQQSAPTGVEKSPSLHLNLWSSAPQREETN